MRRGIQSTPPSDELLPRGTSTFRTRKKTELWFLQDYGADNNDCRLGKCNKVFAVEPTPRFSSLAAVDNPVE